ncbi:MAG TPA: hypothetical protein DCM87_19080 [Planctomycetes bacterium]|nr:hypothetical protein [Planctomycetota bacterium]
MRMQEKFYSEVLAAAPFLRDAVEKFLATLSPRMRELDEALAKDAQEDLRALAHRLKGTGGTHGYPVLSDLARLLEAAVKEHDLARAGALIADIKKLIPRLVPEPPPR